MTPVRWGVLGATSYIHRRGLAPAFRDSHAAELVASASRSGADHGGDAHRRYADYEQVLTDGEVDAVYIPLPNDLHEPWVLAAAAAGKHVLCEKPLGPDAESARRMAAACEAAGVVLYEAYMSPFHPRTALWDRLLAEGRVGRPLHGTAQFTFPHGDPTDHRWSAAAGGGALRDVGIYCLEPLLEAGGWRPGDPPPHIDAHAVAGGNDVDATTTGWLRLRNGFTAAFCCSFDAPERQLLEVVGTDGAMRTTPAFTPGVDDCTIQVTARDGGSSTERSQPGALYQLMLDHVCRVIRGAEAPRRPPAHSIALIELTDHIRATSTIALPPAPLGTTSNEANGGAAVPPAP